MTIQTKITCDECDIEIKDDCWSVNYTLFSVMHFCVTEHMVSYLTKALERVNKLGEEE